MESAIHQTAAQTTKNMFRFKEAVGDKWFNTSRSLETIFLTYRSMLWEIMGVSEIIDPALVWAPGPLPGRSGQGAWVGVGMLSGARDSLGKLLIS